jgi:hypothetical protein
VLEATHSAPSIAQLRPAVGAYWVPDELSSYRSDNVMKYSQLRRGLSPEEAASYVGSKELLRQFERAKWLKPFVRGNRLTRFDIRDLDGCIDRLKAGELLPNATNGLATH